MSGYDPAMKRFQEEQNLLHLLRNLVPGAGVVYHHPHGDQYIGFWQCHVMGRIIGDECDTRIGAIQSAIERVENEET